MCSNSSGSRSARITFCEKRNLRCTLCETTMSGFMCAAPTAIRALPLTGCMTLSTKPPDTVFLCAAHLLTIAAETLKDRIGLRTMLDAVENNRVEAVMVRDLEQISRNSYILVGVIEILRQNDVYLITTECDLNAELINSGLERFVGDRFTRASFGKPRFDVRLPLMEQF